MELLQPVAGENRAEFETIRQLMVDEIQPETNLEWLWLLDLVELSWEILRYRRLKQRVLEACRSNAIESILLRLDGAGVPEEASSEVRLHVRRNVADWRADPRVAVEIEARLARTVSATLRSMPKYIVMLNWRSECSTALCNRRKPGGSSSCGR